jgi:hypothetical protein
VFVPSKYEKNGLLGRTVPLRLMEIGVWELPPLTTVAASMLKDWSFETAKAPGGVGL